jgi:hypothetical protein
MTDPVDTSTCLTKAQAAQILGTSTKGVERAVQAGELVQHWRRQPGTPDVAVYFPDEVAALVEKRAQARRRGPSGGVLVPGPAEIPTNGNGHHGSLATVGQQTGESLAPVAPLMVNLPADWLTALLTAAERLVSQTSETSQTETLSPAERGAQYVTLQEAAAIKRVSDRLLLRWIRNGSLVAEREPRSVWTKEDRGWRIQRKDLEAL